MIQEKIFYLTIEGLENIKKEHETLKGLKLAKTSGEAPKILDSEDLNPEYISYQEDLDFLETRISEVENIIKNARLIEPPAKDDMGVVNIGARVVVEIDGNTDDEFEILGTLEANPALGKISNESPVGRALLGKRAGEEVVISSPIKTTYKIKKIRYDG